MPGDLQLVERYGPSALVVGGLSPAATSVSRSRVRNRPRPSTASTTTTITPMRIPRDRLAALCWATCAASIRSWRPAF